MKNKDPGPAVGGDEIRDVRFRTDRSGYDASQVDDLLRRIAVELDAGRPVGPLIARASFRRPYRGRPEPGFWGYDIDAVDWFLEELARRDNRSGLGEDSWRDLVVGNHYSSGGADDLAERIAAPPRRARMKDLRRDREYLAQECAEDWPGFTQVPGTHLQWVRAGGVRYELRRADQRTIASRRGSYIFGRTTFSTGGRTFTWKGVTGSSRTDIAEIAARSVRDLDGHFLAADLPLLASDTTRNRKRHAKASSQEASGVQRFAELPMELVDGTAMPILYDSGQNYCYRAYASITFPDRRWLRFLVRGTEPDNAIMTAVDQAGNRVARYRITDGVEITVHPDWKLTDELVLAIAISAPWLHSYFLVPK